MKSKQFQIFYDGELLREGEIDARDLAPALLALADLTDYANTVVTGGNAEVKLKVHSDFQRGSFNIDLSLILNIYQQFINVFSSSEAQAWATLFSILGISGIGLFQLVKKSKGRKPKSVITIERTEKVRIEFEDDEEPIEVEEKTFRLFQNIQVRRALAKILKPVINSGIDLFGIRFNGVEQLRVNKQEAEYYKAPDEDENVLISESEKLVRIVAMSFKPENKWRVHDGNATIYASISDNQFLSKVRDREELFGNNDHLLVSLRSKQWYEEGELKTTHEITDVKKHIIQDSSHQLTF